MEWKVNTKQELFPYLYENLPYTKKKIKSLFHYQQICIDGKVVVNPKIILKQGQLITILKRIITPNITLSILYEDKVLIAIEKPAGLLSISNDREKEKTAYHMVRDYLKEKNESIYVLHRLDQETSGILLFAKTKKVQDILQKNWNQLILTRGYLAIVEGKVEKERDTIISWLKETKTQLVYSSKDKTGKKAITHYQVLSQNTKQSLLDIQIETGRKNQIRTHMKEIGHPIIGDSKYGSHIKGTLQLCAYLLEFYHPITKKKIKIQIQPPKEMKK